MRRAIFSLAPLLFAPVLLAQTAPAPATRPAPVTTWSSPSFAVGLDSTGLITSLSNPTDPHHLNFVRDTGPAWGIPMSKDNGKLTNWPAPTLTASTDSSNDLTFTHPPLQLTLHQALANDLLTQTYTLTNTADTPLTLHEGDFGIRIPLPDNYPDAATALTNRTDVHLWMAGNTAWIDAIRMNGQPPDLGLVLDQGQLASYSITDRPQNSNDRGTFVLHPPALTLQPHQSTTLAWTLFPHTGWDDFFTQAAKSPQFIRLQADHYTITLGQSLHITADAANPLTHAIFTPTDLNITPTISGKHLDAVVTPTTLGDHSVVLDVDGHSTFLRFFVTPDPMTLIASRIRFLIAHQQLNSPGDKNDGAFLAYDNQTQQLILEKSNDRNAGRERVAMGVLLALYYPRAKDPNIANALVRYDAFINTHLQAPDGTVFNNTDDPKQRLYNYPWIARFHLAMYEAFHHDPRHLDAAVRTIQSFYTHGGQRFYPIGMPITDILAALKSANRPDDAAALLALFKSHADRIIATGPNMPKSEVNYEQSIVAPACEILLQTALATSDPKYRDAATYFLTALDAFTGRQPDHHLHDIAIRHWDDYWFGKEKLYGDTFPHYWSTLNALVLFYQSKTDPQSAPALLARAQDILANNLSLFSPDGAASCAYVYPLTVNDKPARFYDPWANDQDWALVHYLLLNPTPRP